MKSKNGIGKPKIKKNSKNEDTIEIIKKLIKKWKKTGDIEWWK